MNGSLRSILALALIAALPAATLADNNNHHGSQGNGGNSGGNRGSSSGPSRPPGPPPRPPAPPVVHNQGGFNLPHDINVPPQHTFQVQQHTVQTQHTFVRPVTNGNTNHTFTGGNHTPTRYTQSNANVTGGPYRGHFNGPLIRNPRNWGGWGWNRGMAWYPAPIYWGGGFWGDWAVDNLAAAFLFGSIIDYQDEMIYPSYQVEPYSPGAQLLQNYGLQQTPCGPPNLVAIWGPYNSVICAYPNNIVGPGNYQLDPTTLTITSSS